MKRLGVLALAVCLLLALPGCGRPDAIQMDIAQGYGENIKLLHLNASSQAKRERMEAVARALIQSAPLEKDPALFAYYPDYTVTVTGLGFSDSAGALEEAPGSVLYAIVDVNGEWVDVIFPEAGAAPEEKTPGVVYRSALPAKEFKALMNAG